MIVNVFSMKLLRTFRAQFIVFAIVLGKADAVHFATKIARDVTPILTRTLSFGQTVVS
jgi:hypothetical protein